MNAEDASKFLISFLRNPKTGDSGYSNYGYDIFMPRVIDAYLHTQGHQSSSDNRNKIAEASPPFLAAAWDLCRRGIIRPGVAKLFSQSTDDGSAGSGFAITPFGKTWLAESDRDDYVPVEPERFATMIAQFNARLGPRFAERAQEAVRCYGAHAHLACCVMCGAAAESILLTVAFKKLGSEEKALSIYNAATGRSRLVTSILGSCSDHIKKQMNGYLGLLSFWRDQAAHGAACNIADDEAYTSIAMLLKFAIFVDRCWDDLTT